MFVLENWLQKKGLGKNTEYIYIFKEQQQFTKAKLQIDTQHKFPFSLTFPWNGKIVAYLPYHVF